MVLELLLRKPGVKITAMPSAEQCSYVAMDFREKKEDDPDKFIPGACDFYSDDRNWKDWESVLSEVFGTFVYVLFFMICTDDKLKYSNDTVKNALVIASSYIAA